MAKPLTKESLKESSSSSDVISARNQIGDGQSLEEPFLPPNLEKDTKVNNELNSAILFYTSIKKNDFNDQFDENELLNFVPKSKQKLARQLLKVIDARANELTWNSSGTIFVDQIAVPNSNIFLCFPYLYKQKKPKNLNGFNELLQKLIDMGLQDFLSVKHGPRKPLPDTDLNVSMDTEQNVPWWYLGP